MNSRCQTLMIACCFFATACFQTVQSPAAANDRTLPHETNDWAEVLRLHVDDAGRVDYQALSTEPDALHRVVAGFAITGPKQTPALFEGRNDELAYYINAYNALTMFNVANRWPQIVSVHDERVDFFYLTRFPLDGEPINLYDLENQVIRPYGEPRIHFALNCASEGCPTLPREPFLGDRLDAQLARETKKFLEDHSNVSVQNGAVALNPILEWYDDDFPPDPLSWVRGAAPQLGIPADAVVTYPEYDWTLNAQHR